MKNYIIHDPWCIIEDKFHPHENKISESLCSIGNGRMGQRANFEEKFTGETLSGNYVAGVYYPDKTKVGWWKNGYPEYFAKVLNAVNWIGIDVKADGETVDLNTAEVKNFKRVLNMLEGVLYRETTVALKSGKELTIKSTRFCSIVDDECGAINYSVTPVNFSGTITVTPFLDGDVKNQDSNWEEKFWTEVKKLVKNQDAYVICETKKTAFHVAAGMHFDIFLNNLPVSDFKSVRTKREKYAACCVDVSVKKGETLSVNKYAAILSSENYPKTEMMSEVQKTVKKIAAKGFQAMLEAQKKAWFAKWEKSDIVIEGDVAAQQGIRFNIFQLNQTYTGEDERLNIGPKGFTGEKYGGSTYWDTEAYCLPFYLANSDQKVARNLLVYRYKHLQKAIENAAKLGFTDGAALYPMVTINGEECHNEWEITFEEIHRNGAIAYAIYNYINYTADKKYLSEYGLEVLIAIARFWAQRVHYSQNKNQYVMFGVTGPNEYENNINNNWYTSYIAMWCLKYAKECVAFVQENYPKEYAEIVARTNFNTEKETTQWTRITDNMFLPQSEKFGIFLQQEDYLDKEFITIADLRPQDRPLNQKWSWDRILRSPFIKQADVLQGLYFFEKNFDTATIKRNFDFYEPRTVHESSLSPCVHVILACLIGNYEKAYEMYLRTSRLDLNDYNNDTEDGLHITSMAGTWLSVVEGFGGMRVRDGLLHFNPNIPKEWTSIAFKILFRGVTVEVKVSHNAVELKNNSDLDIIVVLNGVEQTVSKRSVKHIAL